MPGSRPQRSWGQPPSSCWRSIKNSGAVRVPVEAVERAQAQRHADPFERPEVVDVGMTTRPAGILADGLQGGLKPGSAARAAPRARAVCRSARLGREAAIASPIKPAHDIESVPPMPTR